ncbi:hypothetical protein QQ045_019279 [Rhodiola kirilowii]
MEDLGMSGDPNVELQVGEAAAADDVFVSPATADGSDDADLAPVNSLAAPEMSNSPLEIDGMMMTAEDLAMLESLQLTMDLTDDEVEAEAEDVGGASKGRKRRKSRVRKRLSLYQVYSLEKKFKVDSRLEMKRKYQIAKELGLDPRQVTVWFQNRRARKNAKDKEIEMDYAKISGQFDLIKSEYDKVVEENKKLKAEMQQMNEEMTILKDSLLNYGKLMRAGLIDPNQQVMQTQTDQLQVMQAQPQIMNNAQSEPQVIMNNNAQFEPQLQMMQQHQTQPQPQVVLQTYNNNNPIQFGNVCSGGVIAPQVQVQQVQQMQQVQQVQQVMVNSPASVTSVFESNSSQETTAQVNQIVAAPTVDIISDPPMVELPAENNNTNFIQENNGNQELPNNSNNSLISNENLLFDFDDQNCFLDFQVDCDPSTSSSGDHFVATPIAIDDEAFWQFEL